MDSKKISKLISYWLRHYPEDAGLHLDKHGWTSVSLLLEALEDRDIPISLSELSKINLEGEKIRWELDFAKSRIRASHGHSIPIEMEVVPQIPVTELFHGTGLGNLWKILKNGILSKDRQYVHLSDNPEVAKSVGSRYGKPILFNIDTAALIADGWEFFKTGENVWLTKDIPADYINLPPFYFNLSQERIDYYLNQLKKEVSTIHPLFDQLAYLDFFAEYGPRDEVYFQNRISKEIHCVHFTYSGGNTNAQSYVDVEEWMNKCLLFEQDDWFCFKLD
jgi:putative RNA 2'-phosphotransferase